MQTANSWGNNGNDIYYDNGKVGIGVWTLTLIYTLNLMMEI